MKRYEISYFDPEANHRRVLGSAPTPESARLIADTIPPEKFPQILDRWAEQESNRTAELCDDYEECDAGVLHWDAPR